MLRADALQPWKLDDESVDCIVTSPPYYGLRKYGDDPAEHGKEPTLLDYLRNVQTWTNEAQRVLKDTGTFWLNIGDTQAGSGGAGGDHGPGGSKSDIPKYRQGNTGLPAMNACLIPQRVSIQLQADGWIVRRFIIWDQKQQRREDPKHVRRPRFQHEAIIMAVKSRKYRYFHEREVEPGDVWHFAPDTTKRRRHFAPYPAELPKRCILLSTEEGDLVLDPFAGSGTTVDVAEELDRVAIGMDLYA